MNISLERRIAAIEAKGSIASTGYLLCLKQIINSKGMNAPTTVVRLGELSVHQLDGETDDAFIARTEVEVLKAHSPGRRVPVLILNEADVNL